MWHHIQVDIVSDLSYNVGYLVGASQLLGVGKTPPHLEHMEVPRLGVKLEL